MNVIKKVTDIIRGWWHVFFKNKAVEKLADLRMSICLECPLLDMKGRSCYVIGTQPCCGDCGCSLKAATRSLDYSCPKEKW